MRQSLSTITAAKLSFVAFGCPSVLYLNLQGNHPIKNITATATATTTKTRTATAAATTTMRTK